jgi:hypothetical protein
MTREVFFADLTGPLAVDLEGRIFLAPQVDSTAFSANRISRTTILRVDEPTRKLVAMIDLERSYRTERQAEDSNFGSRVGADGNPCADGPLAKAYIGSAAVSRICVDRNSHLYILDNLRQAERQAIRKIDFNKNEITTWAY